MRPLPPRCPPRRWAAALVPHAAASPQYESQCLCDQFAGIFQRWAAGDTPRKVRDIRGPVLGRFFKHNGVCHFNLAFFNIEFNVPAGMSSPSCPGTVTVPGFVGWTYCRWLSRVRSRGLIEKWTNEAKWRRNSKKQGVKDPGLECGVRVPASATPVLPDASIARRRRKLWGPIGVGALFSYGAEESGIRHRSCRRSIFSWCFSRSQICRDLRELV
jgi:hypothetical protein